MKNWKLWVGVLVGVIITIVSGLVFSHVGSWIGMVVIVAFGLATFGLTAASVVSAHQYLWTFSDKLLEWRRNGAVPANVPVEELVPNAWANKVLVLIPVPVFALMAMCIALSGAFQGKQSGAEAAKEQKAKQLLVAVIKNFQLYQAHARAAWSMQKEVDLIKAKKGAKPEELALATDLDRWRGDYAKLATRHLEEARASAKELEALLGSDSRLSGLLETVFPIDAVKAAPEPEKATETP